VQDGLLKIEDKLISFFPEYLTNTPCDNMGKIQVRHLLTMNTGHEREPFVFTHREGDWEESFMQSYVKYEPGTHFLYNTCATYMLSAILQKVTGRTALSYLREKLFEPLGMSEDIWWETSPKGVCAGGFGLNVRLDDLAKLGTFLLHKGKWEGRQLLDEQWILDAQKPWSDNSASPDTTDDWRSGYGYQFWKCAPDDAYRGDGAFGQYCIVMPRLDMVFVANSGLHEMHHIMDAVWENILPAVSTGDEALEIDGELKRELEGYLQSRILPTHFEENGMCGEPFTALPVKGEAYQISENTRHIEEVVFSQDMSSLELTIDGARSRVLLCSEKWANVDLEIKAPQYVTERSWSQYGGMFEQAAVKAFASAGKLYMYLAYTMTPFEDEFIFTFTENGLELDITRNVSFEEDKTVHLLGVKVPRA